MPASAIFLVGALALACVAWVASREDQGAGGALDWSLPDFASWGEGAAGAADLIVAETAPAFYALIDAAGGGQSAGEASALAGEANLAAFLRMIRICETGTPNEIGYRTLYGGGTFSSYAAHPGVAGTFTIGGARVTSTAAGAYQFLAGTWADAAYALGLVDFSPASQDAAAVWLIRRRGALDDVRAGRFQSALTKCGREWASLPGSPYGQPMKSLAQVAALYQAGGGEISGGMA